MKVTKQFYCTQEKKVYKVGDEYTGKRTDLLNNVEQPVKEVKEPKEDKRKKRNIEKK